MVTLLDVFHRLKKLKPHVKSHGLTVDVKGFFVAVFTQEGWRKRGTQQNFARRGSAVSFVIKTT